MSLLLFLASLGNRKKSKPVEQKQELPDNRFNEQGNCAICGKEDEECWKQDLEDGHVSDKFMGK